MKIKATEQIFSAISKLSNGILNNPSDPNSIPNKMNANNVGIPNRLVNLLRTTHAIMITAAINKYTGNLISPLLFICRLYHQMVLQTP